MAAGCRLLAVGIVHLQLMDRGNRLEGPLEDNLVGHTVVVEEKQGRRMVLVGHVGIRLQPVDRTWSEVGHIVLEEEENMGRYLGMGKAGHMKAAEAGHTEAVEVPHRTEAVEADNQIGCRTEGTGCYPKGRS